MAIREIRLYGDPVLKTPSEPIGNIDQSVRTLVADLVDTVQVPGRAGVAAPQIGVNLRAFSYNVHGKVGYLLNPVLLETRGELELTDEGCLSVPDHWHPTPRAPYARARGTLLDGTEVELEGEGLLAQMLQHECDHLDGIVYLDRLERAERKAAMAQLRDSTWF
ncbi:MAG TPA: peptide deformylase [Microbacteriaceae bacterium]|nr:peptide deformylase [Microbacteriaceae bacterium]